VPVRLVLLVGLLLLRRLQFGLDPLAARLLEAQPLQGRLAGRIPPQDRVILRDGLILQAVLLAPQGQPPLILGLVGSPDPSVEIFPHQRLAPGVVLDLAADLVRALPIALVGHQSHQPARQRVGGVVQDRQRQVLHTLGPQPVGLAPQRQPHMRLGVASRLLLGRFVDRTIGRCTGGTPRIFTRSGAHHHHADENLADHEPAP
jgi:hypothetical protein